MTERARLTGGFAPLALFVTTLLRWFVRPVHRARRVPIRLQMTDVECGAACLAMVLGYHGRQVRVSALSDSARIGRDGITAAGLVQLGREHGLSVRAYATSPQQLLAAPLPAIAYWMPNHFVVIERVAANRIDIVDPASGRRRLAIQEFAESYGGVLLTCDPAAEFQPARQIGTARSYRPIVAAILGERKLVASLLAASVALQLIGLAIPLGSKIVFDRVIPHGSTSLLPLFGIGIAVIVLAQALFDLLRSAALLRLQRIADASLSKGFVDHLLSLPYRFFEHRSAGDLLSRTDEIAYLRFALTTPMLASTLDGLLAAGYLAILFATAPVFAFAVLAIAALHGLTIVATNNRMHEATQRELSAHAAEQSALIDTIRGIATIKATGSEGRAGRVWSDQYTVHLNAMIRRMRVIAMLDAGHGALRTAAPLLLLGIGASRVIDGETSVGSMIALTTLGVSALTPLVSLVTGAQQLQGIGARLDRIADVMEAVPERSGGKQIELRGEIDLRQVGFRYAEGGPWVVRDVDLHVPAGSKIAIVGPSGSGKSTLAKLMLGLFEPDAGSIAFDGISLGQLDLQHLRGSIGVVLQEPTLTRGTIRDNIAAHNSAATAEHVIEAATLAALDDQLRAMPLGLDTMLGEGGSGLSGGQRQRIAIARALLARPAVLLLDEATSHLDTVTESRIERALGELGCTRIVIAHRLSTVIDADQIIVLDEGRIVETGTHHELIAHGGGYAALVAAQTSSPLASAA